ncbi:MAG: hypothetical protein KME16_25100 [Scytolyngbya sp. HA4215-MV1]|nr:hypothetical protein [Scytolyngbya sp. HA4215-MV1]
MKVYWSIKEIPELANLSPEQRKQAWGDCYKKYALKSWQSWVGIGVMAMLIIVGIKLFGPILGGAIGGGLGGGIWSVILTNYLRPYLKNYVEQNF